MQKIYFTLEKGYSSNYSNSGGCYRILKLQQYRQLILFAHFFYGYPYFIVVTHIFLFTDYLSCGFSLFQLYSYIAFFVYWLLVLCLSSTVLPYFYCGYSHFCLLISCLVASHFFNCTPILLLTYFVYWLYTCLVASHFLQLYFMYSMCLAKYEQTVCFPSNLGLQWQDGLTHYVSDAL